MMKLRSYYDNLQPNRNPVGSRYFPSIKRYPQDASLVDFEYVGYLENVQDCVTLWARTIAAPRRDIAVKFVDRYGKAAHELLANEGLAPKLLYCGSPGFGDDEPSYRTITMVVMEYVEGRTFFKMMKDEDVHEDEKDRVGKEVRRALELLHSGGFVFGDLRSPNIMVTKNGDVKLIDFNWAGIDAQAKYPAVIANVPGMWPAGVEALAVMKREHDDEMWERLFDPTEA